MFNLKKQISKLYLSSVLGSLSLTGAWVAILAARGYSLVEIGLAETVFHITSLLFEIPSGVLADVFGRKTTLLVSTALRMTGAVIMIFSGNLFMVCASLTFHAMGYNFSSGSGDALAYDSLKAAQREDYYEKYASNQMVIHRLCSGISTLCAGFALFIGHRAAYGTDILMGMVQIGILISLKENRIDRHNDVSRKKMLDSIKKELLSCFITSLSFLKRQKKALFLMFCNSLVGAVDVLLLFFLQAKLPEAGIPKPFLGFALFFMETGGIPGAKIILRCEKLRYKSIFAIAAFLVFSGVLIEHTGMYVLMAIGGFIAAFSDDALQVRTNTILQDMFPSEQRATLISVESFTFSMIMIILSPLAGVLFSHW
ncbi:MAG: MFS transporter [Blautia sp.]|nr:MFS transporter [Blautia sp.]MCM1200034.1 MFS transporter [Bacteroides fragilis]